MPERGTHPRDALPPSLGIVIVNWNSGDQLRECVRSIASTRRHGFVLNGIVVVDNVSRDRSADGVETLDTTVSVVRSENNLGYGRACNLGASYVDSDFVLFLNPDVRLFEGSLDKPIAFMMNPEAATVGILGVQLLNDQGDVQRTCSRFPKAGRFFGIMLGLDRIKPNRFAGNFMTEWDHNESRMVDQVMGAFFLVRRTLFNTLKGFDERFFLYFEEVDFSLRAHKAGMKTLYFASATAYHRGGGSSKAVKGPRLFYNLRSRIQYAFKHFSGVSAVIVTIGTLLLEPGSRLLLAASRFSWEEMIHTTKATLRLWSFVLGFSSRQEW